MGSEVGENGGPNPPGRGHHKDSGHPTALFVATFFCASEQPKPSTAVRMTKFSCFSLLLWNGRRVLLRWGCDRGGPVVHGSAAGVARRQLAGREGDGARGESLRFVRNQAVGALRRGQLRRRGRAPRPARHFRRQQRATNLGVSKGSERLARTYVRGVALVFRQTGWMRERETDWRLRSRIPFWSWYQEGGRVALSLAEESVGRWSCVSLCFPVRQCWRSSVGGYWERVWFEMKAEHVE